MTSSKVVWRRMESKTGKLVSAPKASTVASRIAGNQPMGDRVHGERAVLLPVLDDLSESGVDLPPVSSPCGKEDGPAPR